MAALAASRPTVKRSGELMCLPVKAGAQIYQGGIVMLLSGVAIAARAATTRAELSNMQVVGIAKADALGGATDGAVTVEVEVGIQRVANSTSGDAIALGDRGQMAFVADDQAVAKTIGGGARAIAGEIVSVDSNGVWVDFSKARRPRRIWLPFFINETDTLAPTNAELVSPVVGAITNLQTTVQKAVTTGGDVTALVGTTAVVGLACTIADAATKGTVVTDQPTMGDATTVVAEGSRIQIAPGAPFNTAGAVSGLIEITF